MNDSNLRTTFDEQAELYNEARPRYPDELFEALVTETQLPKGARLLEIGPGTGQATAPLAERGYNIVAVELGSELANVARRELKKYTNVEVLTGAFEDVELQSGSFDLVYAATAFHWIKPEVKFAKPHALLKDGSHLAIIHTNHVWDGSADSFFAASQPIYKKYEKERPKSTKDTKTPLMRIEDITPEVLDERLFKQTFFKVFPLTIDYRADDYVKLISTFSPTLAMPREQRERFLREIHDLIENEFNGTVTKHLGMSLTIGPKK